MKWHHFISNKQKHINGEPHLAIAAGAKWRLCLAKQAVL